MLDFYKRLMEDESLPQSERDNYRKMYNAMLSKVEMESLKQEVQTKEEVVVIDEDDCDGCKI